MPEAIDVGGQDVALQRGYVHVGLFTVALSGIGVMAYLTMTPHGPHRVLLWAMLSTHAASLAVIPLGLGRLLAADRARMWFFSMWSALAVLSITCAAFLDGGAGSPMVGILAAPMVFAAVVYAPRGVLMVGVGVQVCVVALFVLAPPAGPHPLTDMPMVAAVDLAIAVAGASVARIAQRQRVQQRQLTERLRTLALIDGLTGCLNHRAFQGRLREGVERAQGANEQLALILADVDHFKLVNDAHGHPVGDLVLTSVAQLISGQLRCSDVVGRLGGEEFAVLLGGTRPEDAGVLAERLRAAVESGSKPIAVTISLGVCGLSGPELSATALLADADRALYAAKHGGRNRVAYAPAHRAVLS